MKCLLCQKEMEQVGKDTSAHYYCPKTVFFNSSYGIPHFSRYYNHKGPTPLLVEEVVTPPFIIFRVENGRLEVLYLTFTERPLSVLNVIYNQILTLENTQPEDLLKYVTRFQNLKSFV